MAAPSLKLLLVALLLVACSAATSGATRQLNTDPSATPPESRLMQADNSSSSDDNNNNYCWDSLLQLHLCTGEVVLFFLNGETYLGPACCRAIHAVQLHCLPSMMGSLGFTSEEGDILRRYCDASVSGPLQPPPPPPETVEPDVDVTHNLIP
ncbi:egg cell-secreted protein 1.4-like [Malania oleifera]|uniref:egg cell-secreted protein 1.4-like n=1 Tax=Malania oleifera TaxID=397392 RepID=UPI0025ADC276|nr:egg cell-secreted protein 1.4-like [Malania oleifera]